MMEPDLATTAHMKFVDNRCNCCPYGYHIDIDFLRYLDSLGKSTADSPDTDSQAQHKLRQSMELFLRRRELEAAAGGTRPGYDMESLPRQPQLYHDDSSLVQRQYVDRSWRPSSAATPKYRSLLVTDVSMNLYNAAHNF